MTFHKLKTTSKTNYLIPLSGVLLILFVLILYPYYKYYIDPDAVHYLTIAKRYLEGIEAYKYNALWSPMGIWMTVISYQLFSFASLFDAALFANAIGALLLVMLTQKIANRFIFSTSSKIVFAIVNPLFWSYAVFKQSFTDLWFYFFITCALLLIFDKNLMHKYYKWILLGVLGAICFYSKSYALYFFPLMIVVNEMLKAYLNNEKLQWKRLFSMILVIVAIMWICLIPWAILLTKQYGFFTVSTTGSMCLSWFMYGTFIPSDQYTIIQPPLDQYSVNYFEDPWYVQDYFPQFYHSFHFFIKQLIRVCYNVIDFVRSANHISSFYLMSIFTFLYLIIKKNYLGISKQLLLLATFVILFPIGFWLKGFEFGRYIWITVPLSLILMLVFYNHYIKQLLPKYLHLLGIMLIGLSFLIGPIEDMKVIYKHGYTEHHNAQILQTNGVSNISFVSNKPADNYLYQAIIRLAYMSENRWYQHIKMDLDNKTLVAEAKKFDVTHFFYFYDDTSSDYIPLNENGQPLEEIVITGLKGLKIFKIQ